MQDHTGMQDREARKFGSSQPNIARSCGTGEPHHSADPAMADMRRAKKEFDGDRPAGQVSHIVDAGDSGGYVTPYEIDTDDDPAEREARRLRDEAE
ncbi:hypothetical protein GAO09_24115 [Rhizobiales bacterium RZME27]|jgi:hypothetical protein|uniref:Uncharacterized protein n=1 Tax=Endobacterium cereale TaxID=2663029 RepID=A0A6A8AIR7_9HYPH|nr:hypothetical protein [Endobacterium cereale]MEB2847276.1 hypothetical protein [Endobacterium cereale]MQY49126.1 hypothetical protein [Endobacterium cereale]